MSSTRAHFDPAAPSGRAELVQALRDGKTVALPTETVPGLAVLAGGAAAHQALARAKGSAGDRPFTLHLRDQEELRRLLPAPPPGLAAWLAPRMPGPLTVVLPRDWVALPKDWHWPWEAVGLRLPDHPGYAALAAELPGPLLMTSINAPGKPPLKGRALADWLADRDDVVPGLDPGKVKVGKPSPVLAFRPHPEVLRGRIPARDLRLGLRVLVLCTGNICRSPLAAALLEQELAAAWGVERSDLQEIGWTIGSAGTYAMPGSPASTNSVLVAEERGLVLDDHRATNIADAVARPWDLVLGMTSDHLHAFARKVPADLFDPRGREIPDPFGGELEVYREVGQQLERAAQERAREWSTWPSKAG